MRKTVFIAAMAASLAASGTSSAWEYGMEDLGELEFVHYATTPDDTGKANIIFGCNVLLPGEVQFQLVTPEASGTERTISVLVVAGGESHSFEAILSEVEGQLVVFTSGEYGIGAAAPAVEAADDPVSISVEEQTYSIPGGASAEAFGTMMASCGRE